MRRVVALAVVALVAGAATAASAPARSHAAAVVKVAFNKKLKKKIVVDGKGMTLYYFTQDTGGQATCVGDQPAAGCGTVWPPLATDGSPSAGPGAKASLLGTVTRSDGVVQVTYGGHPLYYFKGYTGTPPDRKPGAIHGFAYYGVWFVLGPNGTPIKRYGK
jgi:predicted lipoprotein with Yx(FWY)xxD motif